MNYFRDCCFCLDCHILQQLIQQLLAHTHFKAFAWSFFLRFFFPFCFSSSRLTWRVIHKHTHTHSFDLYLKHMQYWQRPQCVATDVQRKLNDSVPVGSSACFQEVWIHPSSLETNPAAFVGFGCDCCWKGELAVSWRQLYVCCGLSWRFPREPCAAVYGSGSWHCWCDWKRQSERARLSPPPPHTHPRRAATHKHPCQFTELTWANSWSAC